MIYGYKVLELNNKAFLGCSMAYLWVSMGIKDVLLVVFCILGQMSLSKQVENYLLTVVFRFYFLL